MKSKAYKFSVDECRTAYWEACALYEEVRRDRFSTYWQINAAANAVAHWRNEWIKAVRRKEGAKRDPKSAYLDAVRGVCSETGEDVQWVLNHAKRA